MTFTARRTFHRAALAKVPILAGPSKQDTRVNLRLSAAGAARRRASLYGTYALDGVRK